VIVKTWEPKVGPMAIKGEVLEILWLLQSYIGCFAFSLKDLSQLKGQEVQIVLEVDNPIFRRLHKPSEVERTLIQAQIT